MDDYPNRGKRRFPPKKKVARRGGWKPPARKPPGQKEQGWDQVAAWYDQLVGKNGSDYHQHVVLPAAMDLLGDLKGRRILDLCCGQGVLFPLLLDAGAKEIRGVDASPQLIASANSRFEGEARIRVLVDDACGEKVDWADGSFDTVASLMAVHDVPDLPAMCRNISAALKSGGEFVAIFMHPCFRIPRQTHWGWDEGRKLQYRRVDRYGVDLEIPIITHPGKGGGETTSFYHRPLAEVMNAIGGAGLAVTRCEELVSHRRSQAGGSRSKGEHRAAREFPMFLALKAVKLPSRN
ncbi:class I SAM-dependent methyltransferase [Haloferula sp.]|uniref:class I SAM-dependent methyltransferase n=1 Tax=Haloferula sp. TaxID=2497595 RepID=UPI003C794149